MATNKPKIPVSKSKKPVVPGVPIVIKARHPRSPRLIVHVDKATIGESVRRDSSHCMIAEAIKQEYPNASQCSVDLQTIRFSDKKRNVRFVYLTPTVAQRAIVLFDDGKMPEPFAFKLRGAQVIKGATQEQRDRKAEADRKRFLRYKKLGWVDAHGRYLGKPGGNRRKLIRREGQKNRGTVPEVVGGKAPPLSRGRNDTGIPFTRRRAYGVRALTLS